MRSYRGNQYKIGIDPCFVLHALDGDFRCELFLRDGHEMIDCLDDARELFSASEGRKGGIRVLRE
jgi:hypothetical protein